MSDFLFLVDVPESLSYLLEELANDPEVGRSEELADLQESGTTREFHHHRCVLTAVESKILSYVVENTNDVLVVHL